MRNQAHIPDWRDDLPRFDPLLLLYGIGIAAGVLAALLLPLTR